MKALKRLKRHFKKWLEWRQSNRNSKLHQLLVLLGLIQSPTFILFWTKEERAAFIKGFNDALEEYDKRQDVKDFKEQLSILEGKK